MTATSIRASSPSRERSATARRKEHVLGQAHDQATVSHAHAELAGVHHLLQLRRHVTEGLHALGRIALPLAQRLQLLARGAEVPLHLAERRFDLAAARLEIVALLLTRGRLTGDAVAALLGVVAARAGSARRQDRPQRKFPVHAAIL